MNLREVIRAANDQQKVTIGLLLVGKQMEVKDGDVFHRGIRVKNIEGLLKRLDVLFNIKVGAATDNGRKEFLGLNVKVSIEDRECVEGCSNAKYVVVTGDANFYYCVDCGLSHMELS